MARMGFELFAELPITDQQLVLDLAQHPNALNSCLNYLRHEAGGPKLVGDREDSKLECTLGLRHRVKGVVAVR